MTTTTTPDPNNNTKNTITALVERYAKYNEGVGKTTATLAWHKDSLGQFEQIIGGDKLVTDISHEDIDDFRVALRRRGLASESINTRLRSVRAWLNWCFKRHYIQVQIPVEAVFVDQAGPKETFSNDELLKVLAACRKESTFLLQLRARAIVQLLACTGMRSSELLAARYTDIRHEQVDGKEAHLILIRSAKRGHDRLGVLEEPAWKAIQEYREELAHPHGRNYSFKGIAPTALFVSHRDFDKPLTKTGLQILMRRLEEASGVECHAHKFRRYFADRWLNELDGDVETLQELGGWGSVRVIKQHYARAKSNRLVRSVRRVRGSGLAGNSKLPGSKWSD